MKLNDRLIALANHWAAANNRSTSTLASRVVRDGKLFSRLERGEGCNVATTERFFVFFRDAENWPNGCIPPEVGEALDGVDLGRFRSAEEIAA